MSAEVSVRLLTPAGLGGIAVVELAGAGGEKVLRRCFRRAGGKDVTLSRGRTYYGHIVRGSETLDEVLLVRLSTDDGGDVFEINCHGGMVPARRIIEHLVEQGARECGPRQLFLGRRLRTLEREVLEQLVQARTARAADVLLVQLSGRLREALGKISSGNAAQLRATHDYGRRLVEPATVVVTGAPNVGKSTLANALVGRERSIVHHLPGTTRDAVTSVASLEGVPVVLVDTAGLREATDEIERIGVEKALTKITSCDLVVWVFDHSREVAQEEVTYLKVLKGMSVMPVINKIDLDGPLDAAEIEAMLGQEVLRTCALTGRGIDALRKGMLRVLVRGDMPGRDAAVVTTRKVAAALEAVVAGAALDPEVLS